MKLKQQHVNLILGILSLILLVSYIFLFYIPKHEEYEQLVSELEPLNKQYQEAKMVSNQLPELKKTLSELKEIEQEVFKVEETNGASANILNESKLMITLENISDRTQVDMKFSENEIKIPSSDKENEDEDKNEENNNKNKSEEENNEEENNEDENADDNRNNQRANERNPFANRQNPQLQGNNETHITYNFVLRGEYRSIMVFLFELRNLEFPATITDFKLTYNKDDYKDQGFPLTAQFKASFPKMGGVSQ